jgi:Lrp/AsnC family transcriptional regulator of ectoine degradation
MKADVVPGRFDRLDDINLRILQRLQLDARISNLNLAKAVQLSPSACHERMKSMERAGLVRRYIAEYDVAKLTSSVTFFVEVCLKDHTDVDFQRFVKAVGRMPEVTECFKIGGRIDFLLRAVCRDIGHYNALSDRFSDTELGVEKFHGHIVLANSKLFSGYDIPTLVDAPHD